MILYSLICRLYDGMPLVADTESAPSLSEDLKTGAVTICRCLALDPRIARDTPALIITDAPFVYYVLCCDDLACLALCDITAAPTVAFAFLDELFSEFMQLYAPRVQLASRPYSFISFDVCIQRSKRLYMSSASVAKRMPARMAAMPPPRRAAVEELLTASPSRRGSGSRLISPTTMEPQTLLSPAAPTKELANEFTPTAGSRGPLREEIATLVHRRWRELACASCSLCVLIVALFFFIAYLFE